MIYVKLTLAAILFHQIALKLEPYRWLVNSLIHPLEVLRLRKRMRRSTKSQLVDMFFIWEHSDYWFKHYWFGVRLKNILDEEILKRDNLI